MRKLALVLAVALFALLATLGFGFAAGVSARPARVGYPNFACVAIANIGLCIGPPTTV